MSRRSLLSKLCVIAVITRNVYYFMKTAVTLRPRKKICFLGLFEWNGKALISPNPVSRKYFPASAQLLVSILSSLNLSSKVMVNCNLSFVLMIRDSSLLVTSLVDHLLQFMLITYS